MKALTTRNINYKLRNDDNFIGVFALNQIPLNYNFPTRRLIKFITNLDPDTKPGSHWVAVKRKSNGNGFYFDSFGLPPPSVIAKWLTKNSNIWTFNTKQIQDYKDKVSCGYLCIDFLK